MKVDIPTKHPQNSARTASFICILRHDTWVRPYLARYKKPLVGAIALSILAYIFAAGLMFTSGYLISGAATLPASVLLMHLALIAVRVFGLGKPVLQYCERLTSHDWILRVTSSLRLRLYQSLEGQAGLGRAVQRTGDMLGLLSEDLGHLQDMYLRCILPTITAWFLWFIATLALGVFSLPVAVGMFIVLGLQMVLLPLIAVLTGAACRSRAKSMKNEMYAELTDNVLGVSDWIFSGRTDEYLSRHARSHAALRKLEHQEARSARRREMASQVVFGLCAVMLLVWAALYFGDAPATDINSAANYIAAFVLCFFPLIEAFASVPTAALEFVEHADSIERLNNLPKPSGLWEAVDSKNQSRTSKTLPSGPKAPSSAPKMQSRDSKADSKKTHTAQSFEQSSAVKIASSAHLPSTASLDIHIKDVIFAYPDTSQPVIKNLNLSIPYGQKLAVLGRSGAGKSTLAALVRGDVVPQSGEVLVGGVQASCFGDAMPRYIGVIQQDTYLFNDTLLANLRLGNPSATEDEAWRVLDQVGLRTLVEGLDQGLSTMVDEAGKRFSGGERHRIALARVLLQDSPIVILDEPTVGLDPITEHEPLDTLFSQLDDRTIIMVTHHLQGVSAMDRVVFIEDGRIALDGTPNVLSRESERYRTLLNFDRGL